jgi:hypothetical protein
MTPKLRLALELADKIEAFPIGNCGPSDDPDKEIAYLAAFGGITTRFLSAAYRIGDPELEALLDRIEQRPEDIVAAYRQANDLSAAIDYLREASGDSDYEGRLANASAFIATEVLASLRAASPTQFDFTKLIGFCEELNDAYRRAKYLSAILLIRAVMNHVPPVFGQTTFAAVVANAGRSVKPMLERLEREARPIADLHTHILMRKRESLPSRNQVEPYKASFELLLHEVIVNAG